MRRFMSVALIGFALAGATTVAAAQANGQAAVANRAGVRGSGQIGPDSTRARRRGNFRHADMAGITLTAAQKTNMKNIRAKYASEMKQLRASGTPRGTGTGQKVDRTQLQAITQHERADLRAILTPSQQAQFDANVAKAKANKGRGSPVQQMRF